MTLLIKASSLTWWDETAGVYDFLLWELSHAGIWKTDTLLWQVSFPDLFGDWNCNASVMPSLTYLGLYIWNSGFPPASVEILWAGRGQAFPCTPILGRSLRQQGEAEGFATREGFHCPRFWNHTFSLVRMARSWLLFIFILRVNWSKTRYRNLKHRYLCLKDIDFTISRPL